MKKITIKDYPASVTNPKMGYVDEQMKNSFFEDMVIASTADDNIGIGNLLYIPFAELINITYDEDGIAITCDTTEGIQTYLVYDLCFIGDFEKWCKANQIDFNYIYNPNT